MEDALKKDDNSERRYCGLGNHLLKTPHTTIKDSKLLHFALNINPELRHTTLVCMECHKILEKIYRYKLRNALQHRKNREGESISDVSSSQRQDASSSSDPSSPSSSMRRRPVTARAAATKKTTPVSLLPSTSDDDDMPSTSAAAAEKRRRMAAPPQHNGQASSSSDSDLSLNAVNGTRLPHIQPIPKRRQTVHLNKAAMDIYLAGTTGG